MQCLSSQLYICMLLIRLQSYLHAYLICIEREYIRFQKEIFVHLFILFTPIKTYYIEIEMQNFHYGLT